MQDRISEVLPQYEHTCYLQSAKTGSIECQLNSRGGDSILYGILHTYVVVAPCTVSFTAPAAVTLDTSTIEREVWGATATEFCCCFQRSEWAITIIKRVTRKVCLMMQLFLKYIYDQDFFSF